jgi:hypothetical protein
MNRLGRLHDDPRAAAYGDRVPNSNNLYDWSPSNEADDEDELDQILAELRREQPNTHPEILRVLGRSQLDSERERSRAVASRMLNSNWPSASSESLRSAAILQSVRRHPRFSARTRDYIQRYSADRDSGNRSPHNSDLRERYSPSETSRRMAEQAAAMQRIAERRTSLDIAREQAAREDRANDDAHASSRRQYAPRIPFPGGPPKSMSVPSPMLEQTVKYLSRIRYSNTLDDSLNYAIDAGFLGKEHFTEDQEDFLVDPSSITPPAETSWLAPGAVLSGCQHATTTTTSTITTAVTGAGAGTSTSTSTTLYRFRNNDTMTSTLFDPANRPWLSHSYSSPRSRDSQTPGPEVVNSYAPQQDRWPVKVTMHSVDWERMSLSATMEAYNVPSHPHQHQSILGHSTEGTSQFTRTSSITTYLEGEILDFNTHTLLTESFKSSASNDATYWRKLPPFQMLSDDDMVRKLTSRRWFDEVLSKEWILMRWKERCFVKSLNRSTADPGQSAHSTSTPSFAGHGDADLHDSFFSPGRDNGHAESASTHYWGTGGGDAEQGSFDDSGCGLTISGFYYVCLRRSDGQLEGLYYDPQSSPYQCLKLKSVRGGVFPAWGFR